MNIDEMIKKVQDEKDEFGKLNALKQYIILSGICKDEKEVNKLHDQLIEMLQLLIKCKTEENLKKINELEIVKKCGGFHLGTIK
jgi:hypothetical protein